MTKYLLPEILGGGEYEEYYPVSGADSTPPVGTVAFLLDGFLICVAVGLLTKVKPDEPPVGSVVLIDGEAAQRFEDNELAENPDAHWASVGTNSRWTWAQLCGLAAPGKPVLLVLDPFAVPVALPWQTRSLGGHEVTVDTDEDGDVGLMIYDERDNIWVRPDTAREMARALWTAADAKERAS